MNVDAARSTYIVYNIIPSISSSPNVPYTPFLGNTHIIALACLLREIAKPSSIVYLFTASPKTKLIVGESFASRVGVSLLRNVDPAQGALIVFSQREYEDLAVALLSTLRGRKLLNKLRRSLKSGGELHCWKSRPRGEEAVEEGSDHSVHEETRMPRVRVGLPLFDTKKITEDLNRAFMQIADVYDVWRDQQREGRVQEGASLPHIIVTDEKLGGWSSFRVEDLR